MFEVPMSFCVSHERNANGKGCPLNCEGEDESLTCGSDGNVYRNECELKMLNCGYVIVQSYSRHIFQRLSCGVQQPDLCFTYSLYIGGLFRKLTTSNSDGRTGGTGSLHQPIYTHKQIAYAHYNLSSILAQLGLEKLL